MIEFLPFGNVTVAALILAAVLLAAVLVNQVVLLVGRIVLSLDDKNAPKMLESNWLWSKAHKLMSTKLYYIKKCSKGWGSFNTYWCTDPYWFAVSKNSLVYTYKTSHAEVQGEYAYEGVPFFHWLLSLLVVDLAILWIQHHFLSAVWVLSTLGIILTLRFITGKLWNHNNRITTLEEK